MMKRCVMRKRMAWAVAISMLLATLVAASADALGDETYVKLISTTPECLVDCETVYRVCGVDVVHDWTSLWMEYRDQKDGGLRDSAKIEGLLGWKLEVNTSELVSSTQTFVTRTPCDKVRGNTTFTETCSNQSQVTTYLASQKWVRPGEGDVIVEKGGCRDVRVSAKKSPRTRIDNVLALNVDDKTERYTQWAWWNSTWNLKQTATICNMHASNTMRAGTTWNQTLNTASLISASKMQGDCGDLRVLFNDNTELAWVNGTAQYPGACNSTTTQVVFKTYSNIAPATCDSGYAIYYNNSAAPNQMRDEGRVYDYMDDFDAGSVNGTLWSNSGCAYTTSRFDCPSGNNFFRSSNLSALNISQPGWRVTFSIRQPGGAGERGAWGLRNNSDGIGTGAGVMRNFTNFIWYGGLNGGVVDRYEDGTIVVGHTQSIPDNSAQDVEFRYNSSGVNQFFYNGVNNGTRAGTWTTVMQIGGHWDTDQAGHSTQMDNWYATKWWDAANSTVNAEQAFSLDSPISLYFNTTLINSTARETSVQTFFLNVSFNTTLIADINATFIYNSIAQGSGSESTVVNSTNINTTRFNTTIQLPIVSTNATAMTAVWNITILYSNGTIERGQSSSNTQTVIFAYFWEPANYTSHPYEANETLLRANLSRHESNWVTYGAVSGARLRWNNTAGLCSGTCDNINLELNTTNYRQYNATRTVPALASNQTQILHNFSIGIDFNGTFITRTGPTGNHSALLSYVLVNTTLTPANIIEGQTTRFNATLERQSSAATITVAFEYNGTSVAGTSLSSNSTHLVFGGTRTVTNITPNNFTAVLNAPNFTITVATGSFGSGGGSATRTATSTTAPNNTVWKMILTDCSPASASQNVTLRYDMFDETNTSQRATSNAQDGHTVFTSSAFNRTYGFSRTSVTNWTVCIYPYFAGASFTDYQQVQYGDGVIYGVKSLTTTLTDTTAQQNVSLYLLNLSAPGATLVTIIVQDANGIAKAGYVVEVYRYYIPTASLTKVAEDVTDLLGRIRTYLVLNTEYYQFKVYSDVAKTDLVLSTGLMHIYDTTVTLRIGSTLPKYIELFMRLANANGQVTFVNATKMFRLDYDVSNIFNTNTTFDLNAVCLRLEYGGNGTAVEWKEYGTNCTVATAGSIFVGPVTESVAIDWRAIGYVNISASPDSPYTIAIGWFSFLSPLKHIGLFYALLTALAVSVVGVWNPVVFVTLFITTLAVLAWVGLVSGWLPFIIGGIVIGFMVIKALKA